MGQLARAAPQLWLEYSRISELPSEHVIALVPPGLIFDGFRLQAGFKGDRPGGRLQ